MSSFTHDQVAHFREVFNQFSDEESGGINQVNFVPAVKASLDACNVGNRPSNEELNMEFQRITGDSGVIQWQQFFQVLIHLNIRRSASPTPPPPLEPRVQFDPDPFPIADELPPPSYDYVAQQEPDRTNTLGRQLLRSVGNFFGVTDESQRGGQGLIGWEEINERNIRERENTNFISTLSRRASLRNRNFINHDTAPSNPSVVPHIGQSFNLDELGDDSDDEGGLISAAPPGYLEVTGGEIPGGEAIVISNVQEYPAATRPAATRPAATRPAAAAPSSQRIVSPGDLIYNKNEAWDYYMKYIKAEKRIRQRRHRTDAQEFFGSASGGPDGSHPVNRSGSIRRDRLNSHDQESEVIRRPKKKKKTKLQRQSTLIRAEVESLPTFWPIFIVLVSIAQVVLIAVLLPIFGLAPIELFPVQRVGEFPSLLDVNATAEITYLRAVNLWIGPSPYNLIRLGAKFTPCMRKDFEIRRRNSITFERLTENEGCCQNMQWVGSALPAGCVFPTNVNRSNETFFEPQVRCSGNTSMASDPNFHPCCVSITGQCKVLHLRECTDRGGIFHPEADSCLEVNCFRDICGFNGALVSEDTDSEGNPIPHLYDAQQFWRFFTSIFMHLGVIHLIIILPIQLYIGIKIERTIGWLRIAIIYIISGVGGNLVSGIFIPYGVNGGASGAIFGMLGVLYVELFQFWQIVDRAWLELLKLTAFVVFLLLVGTLPYVDNMAHIGGLLFGVPTAIVFVPYITFGRWDAFRKRILLVICVPLVIIMFLAGFLTFYLLRDPNFCFFCHYINCVPYSPKLCPDEFSNSNATTFSL